MKKLATVVFALLLTASLSFAQDTGGDKKKTAGGKADNPQESVTKTKSGKTKGHKGGKKSKKGSAGTSSGSTTPK